MALDPRQDLLVVAAGLGISGLDLANGALHPLADMSEGMHDLVVTGDGKIVLTGESSLALGVVDWVSEQSKRLWEGPGERW